MFLQGRKGGGGKPVIVHFNPDPGLSPTALGNTIRQVIHRVTFGRLYVVVGVTDDIVMGHEDGALGTIGVLPATKPDRVTLHPQKDALVDIEGPTVIARQPGHV